MLKPKVIGVIPARWNSSRFPGKALADINGKSLLQRTYENTARSRRLDELVIVTDDERIYAHAKTFGAQVAMTSRECPSGTHRVAEYIGRVKSGADVVVNIQGDEPCLLPEVIDALVDRLIATEGAVVTTPVTEVSEASDPGCVKCVFDRNGRALYFSRSSIPYVYKKSALPPTYYRHLGVYCFRREFLLTYCELPLTPLQVSEDLEQLKILENGYPIHVCQVVDAGIGVDTPNDLNKIKEILCKESISSSQVESSPL